ncbi:MspA family porin [Mycobacteroides chelonae]|nr:MspA family porin [Mycobacteroides abscessus]MDM1889148.1 MspA family porin [Mycobacteroides abscessus]
MAAQNEVKVTRGGWRLNLTLANETVNSVPNLAAAANSREAFVTFETTATAAGGASPIQDSSFVAGYQLGCQMDVSSGLQLGGAGAIAPSASLGVSGTGPGVNAGLGGGVSGYLQTNLQPGVITDLPMVSMPLGAAGFGMLDVTNLHIKADACGGTVTIRAFAYLRIATDIERSEFAIYGDPVQI